jgi:hypothetical protein
MDASQAATIPPVPITTHQASARLATLPPAARWPPAERPWSLAVRRTFLVNMSINLNKLLCGSFFIDNIVHSYFSCNPDTGYSAYSTLVCNYVFTSTVTVFETSVAISNGIGSTVSTGLRIRYPGDAMNAYGVQIQFQATDFQSNKPVSDLPRIPSFIEENKASSS